MPGGVVRSRTSLFVRTHASKTPRCGTLAATAWRLIGENILLCPWLCPFRTTTRTQNVSTAWTGIPCNMQRRGTQSWTALRGAQHAAKHARTNGSTMIGRPIRCIPPRTAFTVLPAAARVRGRVPRVRDHVRRPGAVLGPPRAHGPRDLPGLRPLRERGRDCGSRDASRRLATQRALRLAPINL